MRYIELELVKELFSCHAGMRARETESIQQDPETDVEHETVNVTKSGSCAKCSTR